MTLKSAGEILRFFLFIKFIKISALQKVLRLTFIQYLYYDEIAETFLVQFCHIKSRR